MFHKSGTISRTVKIKTVIPNVINAGGQFSGGSKSTGGGAVAQRLERWTCDQQVVRSVPILEAKAV